MCKFSYTMLITILLFGSCSDSEELRNTIKNLKEENTQLKDSKDSLYFELKRENPNNDQVDTIKQNIINILKESQVFVYAEIYYTQYDKNMSRNQTNEYGLPIAPKKVSMCYYSSIVNFDTWNQDLRYKFLDECEKEWREKYAGVPGIVMKSRVVKVFKSYAEASESQEEARIGN